ncbi:MAG: hypothetical protein ACLQDV_15125 [Candidatus Binataceae bacterium]
MSDSASKPKVTVISYNPYQQQFPNRRLITRDTLQLVKSLRAQGAEVRIEPENGERLEYVVYKGFVAALLASPLIISAVGVARDVVVGIVSGWIYSRLSATPKEDRDLAATQAATNIAIEVTEAGRTVRFGVSGAQMNDVQFDRITEMFKSVAGPKGTNESTKSPYPDLPVPVFLEHTDKIVGWGQIDPTSGNLKIENARVTDDETWQRLKSGELRGASIAAIAKVSECSICGSDYVDCVHLAGQTYGGRPCTNTIKKLDLLEISLVKDPVNPQALIKIKKGD